MEDFISKLSKYNINLSKFSQSEVVTPLNIVQDMLDLIPDDIFKPGVRFFDPMVKSGRFLTGLYDKLFNAAAMVEAFPNEEDRHTEIITNQLFGLASSPLAATLVRKSLYNDANKIGNIKYLDGYPNIIKTKTLKELVEKGFGTSMKFDVVLGNPPYNNDLYLDFVGGGHQLATKYSLWITPAKWQAKGGLKNDLFREKIVPHMSKIVYYPEATDIFDIQECDGISYYRVDKTVRECELVNKSDDIYLFNCVGVYNNKTSLLIKANGIIEKILGCKKISSSYKFGSKYMVAEARMYGWGTERELNNGVRYHSCKCYTNTLQYNVISEPIITDDITKLAKVRVVTFCSNSIDECKSYASYIDSKFCKFMMLAGRVGSMTCNEAKRFVPDPGPFDHIFTDSELYKKYNLTDEEINIIESVIKPREIEIQSTPTIGLQVITSTYTRNFCIGQYLYSDESDKLQSIIDVKDNKISKIHLNISNQSDISFKVYVTNGQSSWVLNPDINKFEVESCFSILQEKLDNYPLLHSYKEYILSKVKFIDNVILIN